MPAHISIADNDDAGEWAALIPYCLNLKASDYAPSDRAELLKSPAPVSTPFHNTADSRGGQHDHVR